jgi:uncharacterized membrane protein (TIGR02234 family)
MDPRREYAIALAGLAGGGALALAVAQATWVVARTREAGFDTPFPGSRLAVGLVACSLVAMAGAVAVVATRGLARRVVGGLLAVAGANVVWAALSVLVRPASAVGEPLAAVTGGASAGAPHVVSLAWWWCLLALVGGVAVVTAGALAAARGGRWAVMAARYDGPSGSRRTSAPDAWSLLDRGEDPTVDPGPAPTAPDLQQ